MKRCGENVLLSDQYRLVSKSAKNLDCRAGSTNSRRSDKNSFHRPAFDRHLRFTDKAVDLTPVCIALNADVDQIERLLVRVRHFTREHDCAGAGAEDRLTLSRESLDWFHQLGVSHQLQHRCAFATRYYERVYLFQFGRRSHLAR